MTTTRVALVTGANKGIGKGIARGLASRGLHVLIGARDPGRGELAAKELSADGAGGADLRAVRLDVTDSESVARAATWIADEYGRLDVLVNNAGITEPSADAPSRTSADVLRAVYETNVFGVVTVTNAMLPLLRRAPFARIVNVSSGLSSLTAHSAPDCALPILPGYNTSKTALNAITVQYARELRDTKITVNVCAPGFCATDLNDHTGLRTAAQGAQVAIGLAMADGDGPTAAFVNEDGPLPW